MFDDILEGVAGGFGLGAIVSAGSQLLIDGEIDVEKTVKAGIGGGVIGGIIGGVEGLIDEE